MALTGEEFGAIHAAGVHADEDLAFGRCGDWAGFELEDVGAAGGVDYGCFHGAGHCCGGVREV